MPPLPHWYPGLPAVTDWAVTVPLGSCGSWRHLPTGANGQPAVACYLWDEEAAAHLAWAVNVLTLRGDRIAGVTSFLAASRSRRSGFRPRCPEARANHASMRQKSQRSSVRMAGLRDCRLLAPFLP